MELRHFRYFLAVAEASHFTRAAARLGIAVPTLSRQIKEMEQALGVLLFERRQREARLTAAGEVLLEEARDVVSRFDSAQRQAQRAGRGQIGRLDIGYVASAIYGGLLQRHVARFREHLPDVELDIKERAMQQLPHQVIEGRLDLAYVRAPVILPEGLEMIDLEAESFVLALPQQHPLASATCVDPRRLPSERFIMPEQSLGTLSLGNLGGFSPDVIRQPGSLVAVLALVSVEQGVAVVPESVISRVSLPGVVFRPITGLTAQSWLGLVYRRFERAETVSRYLDIVRAI